MHRRRFLERAGAAGVAVGTSLALAGCLADQYDVGMTATGFVPEAVTVEVGDRVVWENTSVRGHTVTAYEDAIPEAAEYFASGGFESEAAARAAWSDEFGGRLENGDRFSHTFSVPGRYDYVCIPHETGGMVGAVIVEE
ncbi:plastocyanin/azurin family copper-binding protein [Halorubrum halodurans]|uniref:Halocyanin n=1 Tax=Halorubrum halodurans TaxID=1383851 RepID=A0A256ICF0_9EURY|nr:plastocyanin/azurin family copper-binding protein [Halorubrum halodurans]OYR53986.1 halocyanin [Halorubrum halodurans]